MGKPEPAAWAWLLILGIVIPFEWWAVVTREHTLSQWLGKHRWAKWLGFVGLSAFLLHMALLERRQPIELPHAPPSPVLCDEDCDWIGPIR